MMANLSWCWQPAHVKNVPGRKTDVNDAMWLAELLAHGLIQASFVPNAQTQEMRNLLRTRKQLVREQASHVQRVQKTLEDANIKLDSMLADVMGKSGRAMIEALIAGETNSAKLASLGPHISSPGLVSVRAMMRPPANVGPIVCGRAVIGLKPRWCSAL
jgi:transposase